MVALLVAGVWAAVDLRNARVVGNTDADHSRVAGPMGHLLTASTDLGPSHAGDAQLTAELAGTATAEGSDGLGRASTACRCAGAR